MAIQYCSSLFCGRPFQVNEFNKSFGKHSSAGKIVCPHCGLVVLGGKSNVFITHALASTEELALQHARAAAADSGKNHAVQQRSKSCL